MKKFLCTLVLAVALVSCGKKDDGIHPLGSREKQLESATVQTVKETVTEEETSEEETPPKAVRKNISEDSDPVIVDVPYYSQEKYPTGCELVSTSMVLAFYGFDIKAGDIVKKGYLKSAELHNKDKKLYGADPEKVFIGNPDKHSGYGCMSGAVILALQRFLTPQEYISGDRYEIKDLGGMWLDEICEEYIDNGVPVIVWCSINMNPTFINLRNSWIIEGTGERYIWKSNEHCLVLTGYDSENYYFNDPLVRKNTSYKKCIAERRYMEMGMQAVAVEKVSP
ncbi:MAG: C39 family peptidase [Ruminococcus sp.]|nr:C39 family peptidase [Ruminococcus sp.]